MNASKNKHAEPRKKSRKKIAVEIGSGNVFADLGLPDAEERFTKSMLAHSIARRIKELGLNQMQAARRMGIDQPKISSLRNGRLRGFSTDRLMALLNTLGRDVVITIQPARAKDHGEIRVMAIA